MRISDWSSDVCSSDLLGDDAFGIDQRLRAAEADDADFRGGFLRGWAGHGRGLYAGRTGFSSRLWPVGPGGGQAASTWRSDIRVRTMRPSREISRDRKSTRLNSSH